MSLRTARRAPLIAVGLLSAVLVPSASAVASTSADAARISLASTFIVIAGDSEGAGFALSTSNGTVLVTAAHVVAGSSIVRLTTDDGAAASGTVLQRDERRDIAFIGADITLPGLEAVPESPDIGSRVYATGTPLGSVSVTEGILSGQRRLNGLDYVTTDAAINPGNSGGPLTTPQGKVIGMVVATIPEADRIGLAVPIEEIVALATGGPPAATPSGTAASQDIRQGLPIVALVLSAAALVISALVAFNSRKPHRIVISAEDLARETTPGASNQGGRAWDR